MNKSPKKTVIKKNAAKLSKKSIDSYYLTYNIIAHAQKDEDFSGASIIEWFDSGREIDAIACPFNFKKKKNIYEVVWKNEYKYQLSKGVIEDVIRQIKFWANDYDAYFLTESKVILKNKNRKNIEIYHFDNDTWEKCI